MAQRTIHYLLGEELIPLGIRDADRFRIGNLLPDAIEDLVFRAQTHYQVDTEKGGKSLRFSDFERFRRDFSPLVETDGLYLGYYMHLVEDACYRIFWQKVRLFERDKRQILPSPAGERFYGHARQILAEYRDSLAELAGLGEQLRFYYYEMPSSAKPLHYELDIHLVYRPRADEYLVCK